jgi:hypothetical protein
VSPRGELTGLPSAVALALVNRQFSSIKVVVLAFILVLGRNTHTNCRKQPSVQGAALAALIAPPTPTTPAAAYVDARLPWERDKEELAALVTAWPTLPDPIRALVGTVTPATASG